MRRLRFEHHVLARPDYDVDENALDDEAATVELGGIATAWAQVLGRLLGDGRWRWAWADDTLHPNVRADARAIRAYARKNGLGTRLTDGTVDGVALGDAALVGMMMAGADGYHVLPQEDGSHLVVLVRHGHLASRALPYDRLPSVMGRLLSMYAVSHDLVLYGWRLYEDGLRFHEREDGAVVAEVSALEGFRVGRRWIVERDGDGTITKIGDEADDGDAARAEPLRVVRDGGGSDLRTEEPADVWRSVLSRSALSAAMRQARFEECVLEHPERPADRPWSIDVHGRRLDVEGAGSFEIQALGAVESDGTWLWGWADASLPQPLTWASADLRDSMAESAMPAALMAPRSGLIGLRDAALVGVWHFDADGYYVAADERGRALASLLWHEDLAAEPLPYERLPLVVSGLIAELPLDHRELVSSWKASQPPGVRFVDDDGGVTAVVDDSVRGGDGQWRRPARAARYRVRFDGHDRITGVEASIGTPPDCSPS
jgi:hypothetical protein